MMPSKQTITARDLPEVRAELATWLADTGPTGGAAGWSQGFDPQQAARERRAAADWAVALRAAELFFVASDMTRMAVSAGLALPSYRLHPEDLPSPHGLLLWEEPATETFDGKEVTGCPIIGMSWAQHGGGVQVRSWSLREDWLAFMAKGEPRAGIKDMTPDEVRATRIAYPQPIVCMAASFLPFGETPGWLSGTPSDTSGWSLAELEDTARSDDREEKAERALVVSWLLMGQTLTTAEEVRPSKASMKHLRRLDADLLRAVRYVKLRRSGMVTRAATGVPRQGPRVRWVVRGHWRQQWYPSRQANRPVWISPHMKGPDGAPILDPDKLVNVLRR
ncbi:hypothetical protein ABZ619_38695 [Streptomyces sp. NPDC007851]|uniref:hypothetical protein n=1 Tax=Streptomyces sp. NPDC007851 TaxID=3155008 RepID=UPI0033CE3180